LRGIFYFSSEALQIYGIFLYRQLGGESFFYAAGWPARRGLGLRGKVFFYKKMSLPAGKRGGRLLKKMREYLENVKSTYIFAPSSMPP
jgi:hypothetical protein